MAETAPLLPNASPRLHQSSSQDPHHPHEDASSDSRVLLCACVLTTVFFFIELIGGWLAGSLAIMSDAAHLLSDLAGFIISLFAVSVSRLPANAHLSFGFARAEVLGAFVSVLFIWALTIVLVIFAIERLANPGHVNGPLMLLLGVIGLIINLSLGLVLGHGGHSHDHAHSEQDLHAHDVESHGHGHRHDHAHDHHHDHNHAPDHSQSSSKIANMWRDAKAAFAGDDSRSVNIRAAYLHVLGDALQNVGVICAAIVITWKPHWSFIDPLCTLLFAVIVIMTTARLAKETVLVLMEGTPPETQLADIHDALRKLKGVNRVGDLHVWSISPGNPALSVHLYQTADVAGHEILKSAENVLDSQFGISHATIQVNCETVACCDEEKFIAKGNKKNCVTSDILLSPNGSD